MCRCKRKYRVRKEEVQLIQGCRGVEVGAASLVKRRVGLNLDGWHGCRQLNKEEEKEWRVATGLSVGGRGKCSRGCWEVQLWPLGIAVVAAGQAEKEGVAGIIMQRMAGQSCMGSGWWEKEMG
ncbi:hypothetical protein MRB53_016376 [Persea americana]|uniref:Uncharacterized protein n=1 Tax=Persea americana TaxID=3435 RepID=A0ACC2M1X6_PERAE|nr:hypothetical protein MRB53_016376 [Persea americana]